MMTNTAKTNAFDTLMSSQGKRQANANALDALIIADMTPSPVIDGGDDQMVASVLKHGIVAELRSAEDTLAADFYAQHATARHHMHQLRSQARRAGPTQRTHMESMRASLLTVALDSVAEISHRLWMPFAFCGAQGDVKAVGAAGFSNTGTAPLLILPNVRQGGKVSYTIWEKPWQDQIDACRIGYRLKGLAVSSLA